MSQTNHSDSQRANPLGVSPSDWAGKGMSAGAISQLWGAARSMSELTPWLFGVPPALVCTKDSGLLAVFELTGLDVDSATHNALNKLSENLQDAIVKLMQTPVYLWFQARRMRTDAWPTGQFTDPVSEQLDQLRQASFDEFPQYTNQHYLCILMQPPRGLDNIAAKLSAMTKSHSGEHNAVSRLILSIIDTASGDSTRDFKYSTVEFATAIESFERLLAMLMGSLNGVTLSRLHGDDLAGYLSSTTNLVKQSFESKPLLPAYGAGRQSPEAVLEGMGRGIPRFLDTRLPTADLRKLDGEGDGNTLLLDSGSRQRFVRVSSVTDFPASNGTFPSQLDGLMYIAGELVVNVVVQCMPKNLGLKLADNAKKYHGNRKLGFKQLMSSAMNHGETGHMRENTARSSAEESAALTHDAISMGHEAICLTYINVLSLGNTPNESVTVSETVEDVLNDAKYSVKLESLHAVGAFSATLPGMYANIVRWLPASVANVADIAPVRTVAMGHYTCKWLTEQTGAMQPAMAVIATDLGTPFWFDPFAMGAGHGLLVGPSGAGKSIMGGFLMTMMRRYAGAQVFVLDKDFSLRVPVVLQGGNYADLSPESSSPLSINPLALLQDSRHLPWVFDWVILLLTQDGSSVSSKDRLLLQKTLSQLSESISATASRTALAPSLSRLFALLPASTVRDQLQQWVRSEKGLLGAFFDNQTDAFDLTALQGFEMGSILSNPQLAAPFTDYLFYRIEQHLKNMRGSGNVAPTMIYLSEVWHLLNNPTYQDKIVDWLKTLRKFSVMVWMDTQSLEDLVSSPAFAALRDNVPNKIYLPNKDADTASARRLYKDEFQLSTEQVARVARAMPKRHYFLRQGEVARMLDLQLAPNELAILRSDTRAQAALSKALTAKSKDDANWRQVYFDAIG